MQLIDNVYGTFDVCEPVLIELLESSAVQRMKGISQMGILQEWTTDNTFTRYDHCVGTMVLVRKLGGSLEEQVAALSHDLSHLAFSHTADWALGDPDKEDLQDAHHEEYILRSEVPGILRKHGLDERCAIDIARFSLLEQPAPALCADRIDYTLREVAANGRKSALEFCLPALKAYEGKIVFDGYIAAQSFWNAYNECQEKCWGSPKNLAYHYLVAEALKGGLEDGTITKANFWTDDRTVVEKLKRSKSQKVVEALRTLEKGFTVSEKDQEHTLRVKFRHIDPEYLESGKRYKLSETMPGHAYWLAHAEELHKKGTQIRIVPNT